MGWFEVDKNGLAQLLAKRGKSFVLCELIQNAWDQKVSLVEICFLKIRGARYAEIMVSDDDPNGFADIRDAFTMFAKTSKRSNPKQRGRFNLGEKLVLAACRSARITTTSGSVIFDETGRRQNRNGLNFKTKRGSIFKGELLITNEEFEQACEVVRSLIPPKGIKTVFNGMELTSPDPLAVIEASLPTEIADDQGNMRRTTRKTKIEVFEPRRGEPASIYEMGIPVVETGDKYHLNVKQKVLLNMERDNVTPAYLKLLRVLVLNKLHDDIDEEEANSDWVRAASSDERCDDAAITSVLDQRFGNARVSYDPTDLEANMKAVSQGYTLVTGRQMNKQEWANAKAAKAILPAGQVTPAKPKFDGIAPDVPKDEWTPEMEDVYLYAIALGQRLMKVDVAVHMLDGRGCAATYCREADIIPHVGDSSRFGTLVFYVPVLGKKWFDRRVNAVQVDELIIHEFAHHYSGNHLEKKYHKACCNLGAKLTKLALEEPGFFEIQ